MTVESDLMSDTPPAAAPTAPKPTRPLLWSLRRELWENRSLYFAPAAVSAVMLVGMVIGVFRVLANHPDLTQSANPNPAVLALPYNFAAVAIMVTSFIVAIFYGLGALHNERRDRSILFWKSLPVSDATAVLSKTLVPLVVLPIIAYLVTVLTQIVILVLSLVVGLAKGMPVDTFFQAPFGDLTLVLLYGLVTQSLWLAPFYGWLLLVSAWAKRAPFLWAFLPPLAVCLIEKIALGSGHFAHLLGYRIGGGFHEAFVEPVHNVVRTAGGHMAMKGPPQIPQVTLADLDPARFVMSPGLWLGLLFAVGFFFGAVWLRRRREPV
jgi:ABC-2 type transport system permease protein